MLGKFLVKFLDDLASRTFYKHLIQLSLSLSYQG